MVQVKLGIVVESGVFFGILDENEERTGHGRMFYHNGSQYEGGFKNGLFEGSGRLMYHSGEIYEGRFHQGLKSGYGEFYTASGELEYKGYWFRGKRHGFGEYKYTNGDVYKGCFKNDLKQGVGVKTKGKQKLIGHWENNKKEGNFFMTGLKDNKIIKIRYLRGVRIYETEPEPGFEIQIFNPFLQRMEIENPGSPSDCNSPETEMWLNGLKIKNSRKNEEMISTQDSWKGAKNGVNKAAKMPSSG